MTSAEFIVKFIAESSKKNLSPVEAARKEIEDIDQKLFEANALKIRRIKLVDVLQHFGDESYRRKRASNTQLSDDVDFEATPKFEELKHKIIAAIAAGPKTVRELIHEVSSYDEDHLVMRTVKWLGDQEIVSRDDEGKVLPGKNWK